MEEEIGIPPERAEVLGILRCNWAEIATMTGIAVTPVVAFIGDLNNLVLSPNPAEVHNISYESLFGDLIVRRLNRYSPFL